MLGGVNQRKNSTNSGKKKPTYLTNIKKAFLRSESPRDIRNTSLLVEKLTYEDVVYTKQEKNNQSDSEIFYRNEENKKTLVLELETEIVCLDLNSDSTVYTSTDDNKYIEMDGILYKVSTYPDLEHSYQFDSIDYQEETGDILTFTDPDENIIFLTAKRKSGTQQINYNGKNYYLTSVQKPEESKYPSPPSLLLLNVQSFEVWQETFEKYINTLEESYRNRFLETSFSDLQNTLHTLYSIKRELKETTFKETKEKYEKALLTIGKSILKPQIDETLKSIAKKNFIITLQIKTLESVDIELYRIFFKALDEELNSTEKLNSQGKPTLSEKHHNLIKYYLQFYTAIENIPLKENVDEKTTKLKNCLANTPVEHKKNLIKYLIKYFNQMTQNEDTAKILDYLNQIQINTE